MKVLHVFTLAQTAEAFFDGQFRYLSDNGHDIDLACCSNARVKDFAQPNNVSYISISIPRTLSPKQDIRAIRQLYTLMKSNGYDVVVGHTPKGALLAMTASRLAGVKRRVYLRHGLIYTTATGVKRDILKNEERFVSALATHIVNVSSSLGNVAIHDRLNSHRKQVVIGKGTCGGIDTIDTFNPEKLNSEKLNDMKTVLRIHPNNYVIGFTGRLCKDKGIPELIEGFELLRQQHPELKPKLLLVGGYDTRDILPEDIRLTIDSDNDIIHTGLISKDIAYYYAMMDVFVFPSHREGFGMCSIEAQAMCVPVLAAKSHGCVDTIEENVTGLYIDLTPQNICDKLLIMHNENRRKEMGRNARTFVCRNFERTILWPLIADFYRSIAPAKH